MLFEELSFNVKKTHGLEAVMFCYKSGKILNSRLQRIADCLGFFLGSLKRVYIALREEKSGCVMLVTSSKGLYLVLGD